MISQWGDAHKASAHIQGHKPGPCARWGRGHLPSLMVGVLLLMAVATGGAPLAAWGGPPVGAGILFAPDQPLVAQYGYEAPEPEGDATTGVGGGTFDVNAFLGAERYYHHTTAITGQNVVAYNLEAGHLWNAHESLAHVSSFTNASDTWGGGDVSPLYDRHATWVAMLIGGRPTTENPNIRQSGMAPGADLRSAAVATQWGGAAYSLSFNISANSYLAAFGQAFADGQVVNSSYGYSDPGGTDVYTIYTDAMSYENPRVTHVASAGNSGETANTVGAPGAGYNTLTVAALGGANDFDTVANFSSRGPQTFAYNVSNDEIVSIPGVRAAVDLAAPGMSLTSAFYGGQTGGNNETLAGSTDQGSQADAYTSSVGGTSFAAPLVAGGAALVVSAANTLPGLADNPDATQSVVVKSLLLTGADKTSGWDNAQQVVTVGPDTFIQTTQSLDWAVGAGRMNLDRTFEIQVLGQQDVAGLSTGVMGSVEAMGWDYGHALRDTSNDYVITQPLQGQTTLTTTLAWMRVREYDGVFVYDTAQADLNLSVWALDENDQFALLIASSESQYNNVEHLSFLLPQTGRYGLRVDYDQNIFDSTSGQIWGTLGFEQTYGLAWHGIAIPEPAMLFMLLMAGGMVVFTRRRA